MEVGEIELRSKLEGCSVSRRRFLFVDSGAMVSVFATDC